MLFKHVGEQALLEEMAEYALQKAYPKIVAEQSIDAIGRPQVVITKLAAGNPLGFRITTAVFPVLELPDYTALATEAIQKNPLRGEPVSDKDVTEAIDKILEHASHANHHHNGTETPDHTHPLPELTDEFVKKLGAFTDVADFKTKVRTMLQEDRERQAREKQEIAIIESIVAKTKAVLPAILVAAELDKLLARFFADIERMGMKPADYLKNAGKTEDDLRKEWRADAEKRAMMELVFAEIAKREHITPSAEEIEHEVKHLLSHHPDANKENLTAYVRNVLANQKVLEFLKKVEK